METASSPTIHNTLQKATNRHKACTITNPLALVNISHVREKYCYHSTDVGQDVPSENNSGLRATAVSTSLIASYP